MNKQEKFSSALDKMIELVVVFNEDMTTSLAREGLTVSRAHLLWELAKRGPTTQRELAQALAVSARNITGLVDGLAATGFVTRQPHPTDRRATLVSFTEHGKATMAEMQRGQQQLAELLFAKMPPERFDHFVGGLSDVLARIHEALAAEQEEKA